MPRLVPSLHLQYRIVVSVIEICSNNADLQSQILSNLRILTRFGESSDTTCLTQFAPWGNSENNQYDVSTPSLSDGDGTEIKFASTHCRTICRIVRDESCSTKEL